MQISALAWLAVGFSTALGATLHAEVLQTTWAGLTQEPALQSGAMRWIGATLPLGLESGGDKDRLAYPDPAEWSDAASTAPTTLPSQLPDITVIGEGLREDALMGPNHQPQWTARRRFVTTRVYVQPPWQAELELGYDGAFGTLGKPTHLLQQELELGLPYRFQIDVENVFQNFMEGDDVHRKWRHESNSIELRYALADWGKIPLNPAFNAEWKFNDGAADAYEFNLLLGEEFTQRLHWGLNLFYENQIGDDRIRELAASQAFSYTLIDETLSAGIEMKFSSESDKGSRGKPEDRFQIGPSVQWRPSSRTHVDVVPLLGASRAAPDVEIFIFFGIEFGPGSVGEPEGVVPASLRGR